MFPLGPSRSVIDLQMQGYLWCLACGWTQGLLPQESHDPSEGRWGWSRGFHGSGDGFGPQTKFAGYI